MPDLVDRPPAAHAVSEPLRERLADAAYAGVGLLFGILALPLLPLLLLTPHGRGLSERLGWVPAGVRVLRRPVWIHAASVGEVLAAEPLVRTLRERRRGVPVLVSTTTVAGRGAAQARLGADVVMLLPVDILGIPARVVRHVRPRCLAILETEIWPRLLQAAARQGVPAVLVSGRLSERAARRYGRVRWLTRVALQRLSRCGMQTDADAARLIALGAVPETVQVTGNLKFARDAGAPRPAAARAIPALGDRPILVAASTHAGEEDVVLDACAGLWSEYPELLLILAPRRRERFDKVAAVLAQRGLRAVRRSQHCGAVGPHTAVLLLDTIGELPDFLPAAHGVFVGGTLVPVGGHNVLEPAMFGKPVAFGPYTATVAEGADALLAAGAAQRVQNAADLGCEWRRVLSDPHGAAARGACGQAVVRARAAVADHTFTLLQPFLDGVAPA